MRRGIMTKRWVRRGGMVVAVWVLMALVPAVSVLGADARRIMEASVEAGTLAGSEVISTMTIMDAQGRTRERRIAQVSRLFDDGRTEKRLLRFLAPADVRGTGFLIFDYRDDGEEMWLYLPSLRRTRRIVSGERSQSFMGSEFSYGDIAQPNLDEFDITLLGEETVDGIECWKIQLVPRDRRLAGEYGWSRRIAFIGRGDSVVRRSEFFDARDTLLKVFTASDIRGVEGAPGKNRPFSLRMENVRTGRVSMLAIEELRLSPDLPEDYFTLRYLERE